MNKAEFEHTVAADAAKVADVMADNAGVFDA
jgi:hypothetical protein